MPNISMNLQGAITSTGSDHSQSSYMLKKKLACSRAKYREMIDELERCVYADGKGPGDRDNLPGKIGHLSIRIRDENRVMQLEIRNSVDEYIRGEEDTGDLSGIDRIMKEHITIFKRLNKRSRVLGVVFDSGAESILDEPTEQAKTILLNQLQDLARGRPSTT